MKQFSRHLVGVIAITMAGCLAADSKILATGGATQLEGQAGGGIVPWAVISGYGDHGEWGGAVAYTRVNVDDFGLDVGSVSIGILDRIELSYSRQSLDVKPLGIEIEQDIVGGKFRLAGDLIYNAMPLLTLGAQYKKNRDFLVPSLVGANDDSGVDLYLAGAKLWLGGLAGRNVFANGTLRYTEANQIGLLGFGSNGGSDYSLQFEGSAGIFLTRQIALGVEYRQKPDNLAAVKEDDWYDLWLAWFPNKRVSLVAAYSDLGSIAGLPDQSGWYLSIEISE